MVAIAAHELLGAPMVLLPLDGAGLNSEIVWLHRFSWHVGSISVLIMAGMFLYASIRPGNLALAIAATSLQGAHAQHP